MIPKGNQRAGGQQLATHLLNAYDNDRVEIVDMRGAIAQDLHGAFAEWFAEAKATYCKKYLYSLSINPDHTQGPFTREHYDDFIRRTEKTLGLAGQPRAVVFHVKHGREHCHVVWSRIDTDKMKAVQLSHDRQKLRAVAQEYARDHNLTLPPGMRNDRGKDRFNAAAKNENLAEKQQEERTGTSKEQRMEQITQAWRENSDARSFVKALEDGGYTLARGDKRPYVVVDLYGEIHSLSHQLTGVKSKDFKGRMAAGYPLDKLPSVTQAQDIAREKRQALLLQNQKQDGAGKEPSLAERTAAAKETARQRRAALLIAQSVRRAALDTKRLQLVERHNSERKALSDLQNSRSADIARDRGAKQPKGVFAFLARITGYNALTAFRHARQDRKTEQDYRLQTAALARRHGREMENFGHQERGLKALDKRERRSLETGLRRDVFRRIAAPVKTRTAAPELTPEQRAKTEKARQMAEQFRTASSPPLPGARALTPEQRAKIADFKRTAAEITAPAKTQKRGQESVRAPERGEQIPSERGRLSAAPGLTKKPEDEISAKFNEAAGIEPAPSSGSLSAKFKEKAEKTAGKKQIPPPPEKPASDKAADLTPAARKALELAEEFRKRATPPRPQKERDQGGQDRGGGSRDKHYRRQPPDFSIHR
jgi:hypothetical protein